MPKKNILFFGLFLFWLFSAGNLLGADNWKDETVDGIVAIVNEDIITLTDLKIVKTFGLLSGKPDNETGENYSKILRNYIEQKLAVQMAGERDQVSADELNTSLQAELAKLNTEQVKNKLSRFDLNIDDLEVYIREKILYQNIISRRFSRKIFVNLEEIEAYYEEKYLRANKEGNKKPQPMMEILNELESAIKKEKAEKEVQEWLKYLREKADIQVFKDKYPDFFNLYDLPFALHLVLYISTFNYE